MGTSSVVLQFYEAGGVKYGELLTGKNAGYTLGLIYQVADKRKFTADLR